MFWNSAMDRSSPYDQIGRLSHQSHHSGQPRVQNGPLMMMQTALQKPAERARNSPSRWMPSVPIDQPSVSRKKLFSCSAVLTRSPFFGFAAASTSDPCMESAKVVVKKNVIASMCAGL